MTRPVRAHFNQRVAANVDRVRIRNLERRTNQPTLWAYATDISPAPTPSDYVASGDDQPFKNGWQNIALSDGSWSPLRWRINHAGRAELIGAIDGGALNTVCVTLPSLYCPLEERYAAISSIDGTRVMTVKIDTNGDVTVVGIPAASATVGDGQVGTAQVADGSITDAKLSDSGVSAGTYGDASHVPEVTVNAKGRITNAVNVAIQIAESAVTGLVSDLSTLTAAIAAKISASLFTAKGDILVASAASTPTHLSVGADGDVLTADSAQTTGVKWAPGGTGSSPLTTKGDLYGHSTADARIPVGSDGQVLTADSGQTLGLKWAAPQGGDTLHTVASSGSSQSVDFSTADVWDITLTAACTLTLTGFTSGKPDFLTLILRQDGTGGRLVTWPTITWLGSGIAPILQSGAGGVDSVVLFSFDGGTTVFGIAQTSASGLRSGTSFPGSPSDGDLFYRTDRRILYEYDATSTHWLSLDRKYVPFAVAETLSGASAVIPNAIGRLPLLEDAYIEKISVRVLVSTTNNGSNFYTATLNKVSSANVSTSITAISTSADTVGAWAAHDVSVASVVAAASFSNLNLALTKTGTPGNIFLTAMLVIRSVG